MVLQDVAIRENWIKRVWELTIYFLQIHVNLQLPQYNYQLNKSKSTGALAKKYTLLTPQVPSFHPI